ncbi:MAG: protein-disulfide reductase DsbD family protein [candidate division KSB1 bacterium]|nr:protein-disulfide reductase DsbD family protein [candidate division KSB1 bacterium]MDZ7369302.1 protein-disulfide reductase DsbD family protein [candidate division KSB1 bacterium]MDZ7407347.1 protein-disulfide reductase DsbD family protein [candidate division KSB1 bacterium]
MMRHITSSMLFFAAILFCLETTHARNDEDEVNITAKAVKDSVRAGGEIKLVFHMQPQEGFHVNVEPAIKLALLDAKNFSLKAEKFSPDTNTKTLTTEDGFKIFDPKHSQPVTFAVKVAKNVKPGKHPLKAKLTYYFCSDKDGYCSFKNQEFVFNVVVVK